MNHTDRQAIGLEHFFAARSGSFSGLNNYSVTDVEHLTENTPAYVRYPLAREIHSSLRDLIGLGFCPGEFIPADVLHIAEECSVVECCRSENIKAFFSWLLDISRTNENDRVNRVAGLKTAAAGFDPQTASFIRTGLALNNQRVVISQHGDIITVSYPEREWGRVYIDFTGCITAEECPPLPMPGYAFSTEAQLLPDGRYEFRFLIDTCFCECDYCERLMQPNGWHEVVFSCKSISVRTICCDYAGRLSRLGTPRAELIDRTCANLISKHSILGDEGLSPEESAMLPAARLITGCGGLLTEPRSKQWQSEQLVLDSLDNRYAMQQLRKLLDDSWCQLLSNQLASSGDARFEDNEHDAVKNIRRFAAQYEQQIADGSARALIMKLSDRFCEMTSGFDGSTQRTDAENKTARAVSQTVDNLLSSLRFEGSFPHYSRTRRRAVEYLSFMLLPAADHSRHGVFPFYISLAAAKISRSRMNSICAHNIAAERTNALDCQPELSSICRYGELASADDGEFVRVDAQLFGPVRQTALKDDTASLERFIRIANRQFRIGTIPGSYAFSRLRRNSLPSPSPRLFLSTLPVSVIISLLAVIAWHILTDYFTLPVLSLTQALCCAAGLCFVLNSILTILRRIHIAGKLWRYR